MTLKLTGNEAKWFRNFLADIPLGVKPTPSMFMHCDCQTTIVIVKINLTMARIDIFI